MKRRCCSGFGENYETYLQMTFDDITTGQAGIDA